MKILNSALLTLFLASCCSFHTPESVSYSISESKRKNLFIQELDFYPGYLKSEDGRSRIVCVWIEKNSEHTFRFCLLPYRKAKDGYKILIKSDSKNPLNPLMGVLWPHDKENSFSYFGIKGATLSYVTFDSMPELPLKLEYKGLLNRDLWDTLTLEPKN